MTASNPIGLYILGAGGHARSVADVALSAGIRKLVFVDPNSGASEAFAGFALVRDLPEQIGEGWAIFPAIGSNQGRRRACSGIIERLAVVAAPDASIGLRASIGLGSFLGRHAHVGPFATIGAGVIINTGAIVDHDSDVGDFTHIAVNATVAGTCRIGSNVMIGAGATVIDGITIADDVIVGAGATVVSDIERPGTYVGTPAKRLP
jgi:sugar O-acyltransferase (sialic acid O-acetyltransferase NeuD family)